MCYRKLVSSPSWGSALSWNDAYMRIAYLHVIIGAWLAVIVSPTEPKKPVRLTRLFVAQMIPNIIPKRVPTGPNMSPKRSGFAPTWARQARRHSRLCPHAVHEQENERNVWIVFYVFCLVVGLNNCLNTCCLNMFCFETIFSKKKKNTCCWNSF